MSEQRDYRDTVFLPKTDFPMKAGLPQKEPGILARWEDEGLYQRLREARADSMAYQYRCVDPEISLYRKTPVQ